MLTAIRTSAASALATDVLVRKDATRLVIIGNGEQAMRHVHAMRAVRDITDIAIWGRNYQRASDFAYFSRSPSSPETSEISSLKPSIFKGLRTSAVTLCPRHHASLQISCPERPLAPNSAISIPCFCPEPSKIPRSARGKVNFSRQVDRGFMILFARLLQCLILTKSKGV